MPTEVVLTMEGLERLEREIEQLKSERRREVADRLRHALEMGRELAENAEFLEAKEEQVSLEQRIARLEERLASAHVVAEAAPTGVAGIGSHVRVRYEDDSTTADYELVGSGEGDPAAGSISSDSPVGSALLGHREGEIVQVDVPKGAFRLKILKVASRQRSPVS
jgi:transcription elongation factor GreA